MGRKVGAVVPLLGGGLAEAYLHTKSHLDTSSNFSHNRHGPRFIRTQVSINFESGKLLCPFPLAELNPHLTQCGLGQGKFLAIFCVVYSQPASCSTFQTCILNLHKGHTMCGTMLDIQSATAEIRQGKRTGMWADVQRYGRPAEYRWRPLFNAAKFA